MNAKNKYKDLSDESLLNKIRKGDEAAYKEAFIRYYKKLVLTAYQIIEEEDLSKDAAQEVFFQIWKNKHKLPDKMKLLPYLKRSVINRSYNTIKSRSHHRGQGEDPIQFVASAHPNPESQYQEKELRTVIAAAIQEMPPRCRSIYLLCRIEGMSHAEISKDLQISKKTIEKQMTKALKIIKTAIVKAQLYSLLPIGISLLGWGQWCFELFCNKM